VDIFHDNATEGGESQMRDRVPLVLTTGDKEFPVVKDRNPLNRKMSLRPAQALYEAYDQAKSEILRGDELSYGGKMISVRQDSEVRIHAGFSGSAYKNGRVFKDGGLESLHLSNQHQRRGQVCTDMVYGPETLQGGQATEMLAPKIFPEVGLNFLRSIVFKKHAVIPIQTAAHR
jgi:hypothetical protein